MTKVNLEKSDEEWRKILNPEQFRVLREKGTEPPGTGKFLHNKEKGVYVCGACGAPLFKSNAKFESGSGWPSFYESVSDDAIVEQRDTSHGMVRTEVLCGSCKSHLGHVFNDGPRNKGGLRYCINSISLDFRKKDD
ncbi:MAG: peptide-methionine (R)-S-oxide reductase MsrB [Candidatus Lokiarchaeota archaeon]|nr:peptide-methionine (R)-S-oxide reductase MsrB [Candidatus Lokiarchaeota archaeon]